MAETLRGVDPGRLERSCGLRCDRIRFGTGGPGFERAEISLATCAYEPHRHDSYALGVTLAGVQRFRYRGAQHIALPGQLHVLHPDELHDGAAATDAGLRYRIFYLAPELVRDVLDRGELPFVADPVQPISEATLPIVALLRDLDEPVSDLAHAEVAVVVADALRALGGRAERSAAPIDFAAVGLARDYLAAHACEQTSAATLERVTGSDRFTLARHFRRAFGTSPDRYRMLRRLALARQAVERGEPLVQVAARAGFADQSHLTRQFKRAYGVTPARWAALTASG
jgi:AraC-like DNA-binding protein